MVSTKKTHTNLKNVWPLKSKQETAAIMVYIGNKILTLADNGCWASWRAQLGRKAERRLEKMGLKLVREASATRR